MPPPSIANSLPGHESRPCADLRRDLQLLPGEADSSGDPTWLLFDPVADRYFRISGKSHAIISRWSSRHTPETLQEVLLRAGIEVDVDEILRTAVFLESNNLLMQGYGVAEKKTAAFEAAKEYGLFHRFLASYISFRVPLWNPDHFLDDTAAGVRRACNRWVVFAIVLVAILGYIGLGTHWEQVVEAARNSLSFAGLFQYSLAIIALKVFHEFAHAYAAKWEGVRVRRMGIAFIVFFPRFYTDLTDAWRILDARKRMVIDAAGILFELVAGGWAALVWWNTGPGLVHQVAFNIFAVATLNTVFVNGNPAIRYDGYYLLMDFIRIDNLQQRATQQFQGWFRWIFFGIPRESQPQKIQKWRLHFLSVYAVLAFFYRIFLYTSIILIVYWKFTKVLGIILLILEAYLLFLLPLAREIKALYLLRHQYRILPVSISAAIFAGIAIILLVPLPWALAIPCEARPASRAVAAADQEGFLKAIHIADGQTVKSGQLLFSLENPFDEWQEKQDAILARHLETEADQLSIDPQKLGISQVKLKQLATVKGRLDEARRRRTHLAIDAAIDGRVSLVDPYLSLGKWIKAGEPLADVYNPVGAEIEAFVRETDLRFIHVDETVAIRFPDELKVRHGVVRRIVPAAVEDLHASPLLDLSNGPIATIPGKTPITLRDAYYRINILPDPRSSIPPGRSGEVIAVRHTSIAAHLYAIILNLLQKELSF